MTDVPPPSSLSTPNYEDPVILGTAAEIVNAAGTGAPTAPSMAPSNNLGMTESKKEDVPPPSSLSTPDYDAPVILGTAAEIVNAAGNGAATTSETHQFVQEPITP